MMNYDVVANHIRPYVFETAPVSVWSANFFIDRKNNNALIINMTFLFNS